MTQATDPFAAARSALSQAPVAPTSKFEVHGPNVADLPDDFLCELGRFFTRFARLRVALSSLLQAQLSVDNVDLTEAQVRRLAAMLSRGARVGTHVQPLTVEAYMRRYQQLALIADRLCHQEWRATPGPQLGAKLENWPPTSEVRTAANEARPSAERLGDRIARQEIESYCRHCLDMHLAIMR